MLTVATVAALVAPVALTSVTAGAAPAGTTADAAPAPGGTYVPVTPSRILDTRSGYGAAKGATTGLTLSVDGRGGVPTTGVAAVVLNLTVTAPVSDGWLSVGPQSTSTSSNVNFLGGQDVAQLAVSQVAADGTVAITANVRTQVVADVVGWFTDTDHVDAGGTYTPVASPVRAFDSRLTGAGGALRNGQARSIALPNRPAGASSVVVNLTAIHPDHQAYLSAWPGGTWAGTSSMNVAPGDIRSNRAIVPIGADGTISLVTNALTLDVVVDVNGWFGGSTGGYFVPAITRIIDTRSGLGAIDSQTIYHQLDTLGLPLAGQYSLPDQGAMSRLVGAWTSTTIVATTTSGWTAFTPNHSGVLYPPVVSSDINWDVGVTANVSILVPGDEGEVRLVSNEQYNYHDGPPEEPDLVVDLDGYFVTRPAASEPGLWVQSDGGGSFGQDRLAWNRPVPNAPADVVAVAGGEQDRVAVLGADGTVSTSSPDFAADTKPTVLDHAGVSLTGSASGFFVTHADGTVWTDDWMSGMRGTSPDSSDYGQVGGVGDVTAVVVPIAEEAWGLRRDGSVVTWGFDQPPTPVDTGGSPVRSLDVTDMGGLCLAHADGSIEVQYADGGGLHTYSVAGLQAVSTVQAFRRQPGCYSVDSAGRLTVVTVGRSGVTATTMPGPPVAQMVDASFAIPYGSGGSGPVDLRALGRDGVVRDLVGTQWYVEPGLTGATAIAGGNQLLTYVPPAG